MGHHSPGQQCQGLNPSPHTQQVSVHHTHLHRNPTPTPSFLRRPQRARTGSPYRLLLPAAPLSAAPTPGCPGAMLALPGRPRATLSRAGRGAHSTAAHSSVPPALGAPLLRWHGRPLPAPAPQPPLRVQTELRPDGRSRGGAAARRSGRRAVPGAGGMGPPGEQRGAGAAGDLAALAELDEAALLGALRDRFLRQQIYVSAGAGRGAWGSALPSRLSLRSPLSPHPPVLPAISLPGLSSLLHPPNHLLPPLHHSYPQSGDHCPIPYRGKGGGRSQQLLTPSPRSPLTSTRGRARAESRSPLPQRPRGASLYAVPAALIRDVSPD